MTVSICVPWRDSGCEWRARAMPWCTARFALLGFEIVFGSCGPGPWNASAALNDAAARASGDVLVFVGADTVLDPSKVLEAVELAAEGVWVMACSEYRRLTVTETIRLLESPLDCGLDWAVDAERSRPRHGCGPLVVRADVVRRVGGWDERFVGWGGEDEAFGMAAATLVGPAATLDASPVWLTWHPRADRKDPVLYRRNLKLLGRYHRARNNATAMRALLDAR